ncbi:MAG TPA: hypothetical protein VEM40_14295 [Nitrospirota bacterium]|nr:hypothetical protein [Nitrospirota bacterium]
MKSDAGRSKKQRKAGGSGAAKHPCGTLSYLAECRGNGQKAGSERLPETPNGMSKIVRKHPADR